MSHHSLRPLRPLAVEAREEYRIWLRYADGVEGEVDLSHLVGKGVFAAWRDPDFFAGVHLIPGNGIAWSDEIDLCPDALYLELTGKSVEDIWPALKERGEGPDETGRAAASATSTTEISRFYGMVIRIHANDHGPPRIHAHYEEDEAVIGIHQFGLVDGKLPPTAIGLVIEWMARYQDELLAAWERAQRGAAPGQIAPLD